LVQDAEDTQSSLGDGSRTKICASGEDPKLFANGDHSDMVFFSGIFMIFLEEWKKLLDWKG